MLYYAALILITAGALFNRSAFPYVVVLCTVWAAFCLLGYFNAYAIYPWVDALSIYPLAYLAWLKPKWWSLTIVGLCFLTVVSHLAFWTFYYSGVYLGEEYKIALRSLFLLSMAVALMGDIDVKRLVGLAVERLRGFLRGSPSVSYARGAFGPTFPKEALGEHSRTIALCGLQHSEHRMGHREARVPGWNDGAQAGFSNRRSDVGSNSSLYVSTKKA